MCFLEVSAIMPHGPLKTPRPSVAGGVRQKRAQHKIKKILPIILTVTILATTAKAGIGWSLEECMQHYGKPVYTNSDPFTDLLWYHFKPKGFEIQALLNNAGRVVGITYFSHEMSEQDINNLLASNAPKAEWRKRVKDDNAFWDGLKDGSRKYSARSYTLNDPNASAEVYGTVLEIETMEVAELRKTYHERTAKTLRDL
jgi:hypothetical protein